MRLIPIAAAAALACIAPSVAAQNDAMTIARQAMERLMANHGDVQDYTLVLEHEGARVPMYVYREGDSWQVSPPADNPLGDLLSTTLLWAVMSPTSPEALEETLAATEEGEIVYAGTAAVEGRQAHVLSGSLADEHEALDSLSMYVDARTRQLLRVAAWGSLPGEGNELLPQGAALRLVADLSDYTLHDGLTLPMSTRLRMALDVDMNPAERQAMQTMLPMIMLGLQQDPGMDEGERMAIRLFVRMMLEGEVDLQVRVVDVQVNSGRPDWPLDENENR